MPPGGVGDLGPEGPVGRRLRAIVGHAPAARGAPGPHPPPAVRVARRRRRRRRGRARRDRHRRRRRTAPDAAAAGRGRGAGRMDGGPRADRAAAARLVRAAAGAPLQVRGGPARRRPRDPGLARPRAHRRHPGVDDGRARLRRRAAPAGRRCAPRSRGRVWARTPRSCTTCGCATRRLRAALSLFADVLPVRAQVFREELGWLGRTLGAVRDLDVQLAGLADMAARHRRLERRRVG